MGSIADGIDELLAPFEDLEPHLEGLEIVAEGLDPILSAINEIPDSLEAFTDLKPLDDTAKTVSSNKFQKGVKAIGGMWGQMINVVSGGVLDKLMSFFESLSPLTTILTLLQPVLDVISAIFEESMVPVLEALMPIMIDLSQILLENKEAVAIVISVLNPLVLILQILAAVVSGDTTQIQWLIDGLTFLGTILFDVGSYIGGVFIGIWEGLVFVFTLVYDTINDVYIFITETFIGAWEWLLDIIKDVSEFMEGINPLSRTSRGSGSKDDDESFLDPVEDATGIDIPFLQEGGIAVAPTLAMVGEGREPEPIMPLSRLNELINNDEVIFEMEQNRMINQKILKYLEEGRR